MGVDAQACVKSSGEGFRLKDFIKGVFESWGWRVKDVDGLGVRDVDGDVGGDRRVVSCCEMVCVIGIGNESSGVFEWFMVFEMGGDRNQDCSLARSRLHCRYRGQSCDVQQELWRIVPHGRVGTRRSHGDHRLGRSEWLGVD